MDICGADQNIVLPVCQAIEHAHQKEIIHRDIKPSNILVSVNDGMAVPKVIDFGIPKASRAQPACEFHRTERISTQ